ncbi:MULTISPECIES: TetR/AcrR family transcriptional regulator [Aneurinibacillus]|uniref:DNA-binding transcriptional regulator, AcrR family n=1 Tax=Aneurinibacillus thermoaerophilus TaxID=143495 RepID=A0A1G8ATW1_ANETH|nr:MULTISPECIES: TetR/AcrR family transcriptional regulator [Aneurinibacillus]AMA72850.1 TetR family transcriptional regulator [Aneurinibacillus sp. XH2]MED0677043.1 TetR/AcrR family transcriptional regulator [Aneurinibacillus thermoaerophilus]MED0680067.1 TetR/AcrR family transcriptional regulator [Aneurinibacillus thermoaerophilus]MED0738175.1 TetR/AcrR family transcriptional regulator [Aneurinibacillus thermoaerophilus]MED0758207.1 TetR/AcrR family transcriptional regulator [Aneurinibacillu
MDSNRNDTREKILLATIKLMRKEGIKAMTTRKIAKEAGVNEVTLFRHFGNKEGLAKAAVEKFSYESSMLKIFQNVEWDLEKDLYEICKAYQEHLNKNQDVIMIGLKEANSWPGLIEEIANIPRQLKVLIINYFSKMQEKGKIINTNPEAQAMNFMWVNFGFFLSRAQFGENVTNLSHDEFIKHCVQIFSRGLKP